MVLKFKVWRLQWETRTHTRTRTDIVKGRKRKVRTKVSRQVLVLRDKSGKIRKVAHNADDEARLQKWYEKYNVHARLEQMLAVRKLKEHVRIIKNQVRRRGFRKQLSCYGIYQEFHCPFCNSKELRFANNRPPEKRWRCVECNKYFPTGNRKAGKRFYCRYEIFRRDPWTQSEVAAMHDFLKSHRPTSAAGVFIYHANKLYVVKKDKVTRFGVERLGYKGERRDAELG